MSKMSFRLMNTVAVAAIGLSLIGGSAMAQQAAPLEPVVWDKRALDRLDRNVRRMERALTQRNAAGQPVVLEPEPEVVTLQGQMQIMERRVADLEATFQRVNADNERVTFQLDEATRNNEILTRRLRALEERWDKMEKAAAEEAELNGPIVANSPTGDAARDLAAAVQLLGSDARRGERALQTVIVTWPDGAQAREANLRLGDYYVSLEDEAAAVPVYAAALKDWPRLGWAAEATLKLADALTATDRKTQACGALNEFNTRYAPTASAALKTRATQARTRANCR